MIVRTLKVLVLAGAGLLVSASIASAAMLANIPEPTVTGPVLVTATSYPFLATDQDLAKYGYVEEEFFIEGDDAYRYDTSGNETVTGTKITTGGPNTDGTFPFKTRIVIRRPANPADFNGTVVAEWNNVTATQDVEFNWFGDPEYMLKNGYAFVGVTAQTTGVASLKSFDINKLDGTRYQDLTVDGNGAVPVNPGDDRDGLSYDVFSSALRAVTHQGQGVDPLSGFNVQTVIASGESQSCGRLSAHYNKIEPLHEIADAYLLTVCTSKLRTDRPEKAIRVITETENRTPRLPADLPDTGSLRHWEVAGASHLPRLAFDNLNGVLTRDFISATASCQKFPLSLVQWPFTANRAIDSLVTWSRGGAAPPIAPRGNYVTNPDPGPPQILARDANGIALGAIRYPEVTVPTAVNDGTNAPAPGGGLFSALCGLFGSTTTFPEEKLSTLYTDYADYVNQSADAADQLAAQDFVLPQDVPRLKQFSRNFPGLRPTAPMLVGDASNRGSFGLTWVGTEAADSTFEVQRKDARASAGTKVGADPNAPMVALTDEPEGTNTYSVRSSTVIPETNISAAYTVTTPFSEDSVKVKVDRTGPRAPTLKPARKPNTNKNGRWYRGSVKVKVAGRPDRVLPDGTPGSGLDVATVPKTKFVKKSGRTKLTVNTRDTLGNQSETGRLTIQIDRTKPKLKLICPKKVKFRKTATARLKIRDNQSGVRGKSKRRVRIDTNRAGRKVVKVRVSDRVGNKRSAKCVTRVKR